MIPIVDGLYLGNRQSARDLRRLRDVGITHIVNCTEELPNYHDRVFRYYAVKLRDPDPALETHITSVCQFIDEARSKGKVLVHCYAAVSRSPSIILSYLCHLGASLEEAAKQLGGIVWTHPDTLFLQQVARHLGLHLDEKELRRLTLLLQGRTDDIEDWEKFL